MVDSLYEDAHDSFDDYHHQPLEHNPYVGFDHHEAMDHQFHGMAEHAPYYDEHGYDPHHDPHYDLEHNPYEYENYSVVVEPLYEDLDHHGDAFAYETYREYPHEPIVPIIEPAYHEQVIPVYHDDYEHHEYIDDHHPIYDVEIPLYSSDPYAYEHHDVAYHPYDHPVHGDWHHEPVHHEKPIVPKKP